MVDGSRDGHSCHHRDGREDARAYRDVAYPPRTPTALNRLSHQIYKRGLLL
ncbi:MAG: hypothetical protein JWN52_3967 [Actinomycetia bacterium]|nr:hypothetical protein [Actinomycetes bacterium]